MCALLASAACSSMQPHAVAGARPAAQVPAKELYLACSAPSGRLAYSGRPLGSPSGTLTGTVYFSYLRVDSYWIPTVSLAIYGATKKETVQVLKIGTRSHEDYDHLRFSVPQTQDVRPIRTDVHFEVQWTPTTVRFRLAGDPTSTWATVPVAWTPHAVGASCSTADAVFYDVDIAP
jgi:hypothetical protein